MTNLWQPTRGVYADAAKILSLTGMPTDTMLRLVNRSTGARITDFRWTGSLWLFSHADLTAVSTSRYGSIASVENTTSITLTAGHTLVTGDVVHILDVSAGAELTTTYRTITVTGNVVTWTGAVASMAAGDLVFARGVSEIEIDCSATGLSPWAGIATAVWASGLSVVCGAGGEGRVTAKALRLGGVGIAAGRTRAIFGTSTTTGEPNASGDYVGVGGVSLADATKSITGGLGHNGTSLRLAKSLNGTLGYGTSYTSHTWGQCGIVAVRLLSATDSEFTASAELLGNVGSASGSVINTNHTDDCVLFDVRGSQSVLFTGISRA